MNFNKKNIYPRISWFDWQDRYKKIKIGVRTHSPPSVLIIIMIAISPLMYKGLQNSKLDEESKLFINEKVLDLNNPSFSWLDIEEPPEPLKELDDRELFHKKFLRKTMNKRV